MSVCRLLMVRGVNRKRGEKRKDRPRWEFYDGAEYKGVIEKVKISNGARYER